MAIVRVAPCLAAVAENASSKMLPVCVDSTEGNKCGWRIAKIKTTSVVVTGGFAGRRELPAACTSRRMAGVNWRFVHVHKNARWFVLAVAGPRACKGDLSQVKILDTIRDGMAKLVLKDPDEEDEEDEEDKNTKKTIIRRMRRRRSHERP